MATITLTKDNFNQTIENNDIVLVDFWASWCGPCRAFKPIFEAAAAVHPEITFASCNTEEEMELAGTFRIQSIPTLMVFRERVLVYAQPGMLPKETLEGLITQVKALDMHVVHAEVAKEHAGEHAQAWWRIRLEVRRLSFDPRDCAADPVAGWATLLRKRLPCGAGTLLL